MILTDGQDGFHPRVATGFPRTPAGADTPSAWNRQPAVRGGASFASAGSTAALRLLLVEDNPGDARLVRESLSRATGQSFAVTHVDTLRKALDHLSAQPVDVVLLDLSLPDSHGMTTLENLQRGAASVPVVVLTGHDEPGVAENVLERGAQDFIAKRDLPDFPVARAISWAISRMHAQTERAMLIERLAREQERLMVELHHARQTQLALLPRGDRLDETLARMGLGLESRFEPSFAIGGDLWGAFELDDRRIAFYAFDFSGHGISAALNVFRLHTLLDDHDEERDDPARLLADLNCSLTGLLGAGQFATMFYGIVDIEAGELRWSAAGAPRPLLVTGSSRAFLDTAGIPLGISRDAVYQNRVTAFPRGGGLLLYSDALCDAVDSADDFLGEEGVEALVAEAGGAEGRLSLDRLLDRFFERARAPLTDDLTVLWITRT
ncbi:MAG: SpoIIE family protein phosphatase [Pseudomonadota bacterium]